MNSKVEKRNESRSDEHQGAESEILRTFSEKIGFAMNSGREISLHSSKVKIDGMAFSYPDMWILAEVYAHVGKPKAAQKHKICSDLLKLILVSRHLVQESAGTVQCFMLFGCPECAAYLLGDAWAAEAARTFGVQVEVVELPAQMTGALKAAQARQDMRVTPA